jgi:hypothetical protein
VAAIVRQGMEEGVFHQGDPDLLAASVTAVMQVQLGAACPHPGSNRTPRKS